MEQNRTTGAEATTRSVTPTAPLLSIVVPTYNERTRIAELVRAVFEVFRTHALDGELVVVDDNSPDGTGAIVDVGKVDPMPKAAGKWNVYEITAHGPHFVVTLNGQKTVDAQDSKHANGYIALQYGSGVVKFRKVQIKPL